MRFHHRDYENRDTYVAMPIVYILKDIGRYDGVYSSKNSVCNSFSKGSVKFIDYHENVNVSPVNYIMTRNGTDKIETNIKYEKSSVDNLFHKKEVKNTPKVNRPCAKCGSTDHKLNEKTRNSKFLLKMLHCN